MSAEAVKTSDSSCFFSNFKTGAQDIFKLSTANTFSLLHFLTRFNAVLLCLNKKALITALPDI
jgi:hypothetical protein